MTIEEMRDILHRLHLDAEVEPNLIYVFYATDDGRVNNFSISLHSARQRNRHPLSDEQLVDVMQQYPDARGARVVAIEHPRRGLSQWLDTHDVCALLHTTRRTIYSWRRRGLLHPSRLGGHLYFDAAEVESLLRSNIIQPNGKADFRGTLLPDAGSPSIPDADTDADR